MDSHRYISLAEAAARCEYSQEYLSLRARQGKLKAAKQGRNWVTTHEWLIDYLRQTDAAKEELKKTVDSAILNKEAEVATVSPASLPNDVNKSGASLISQEKVTDTINNLVSRAKGIQQTFPAIVAKNQVKDQLLRDEQPVKAASLDSWFEDLPNTSHAFFEVDEVEAVKENQPKKTYYTELSAEPFQRQADRATTKKEADFAQQIVKEFQASDVPTVTTAVVEPVLVEANLVEEEETKPAFALPNFGFSFRMPVVQTVMVTGLVLLLVIELGLILKPVVGQNGSGSSPVVADASSAISSGRVAGAEIDKTDQQHFSVVQDIAAGILEVTDHPEDGTSPFGDWLISTFNLPK